MKDCWINPNGEIIEVQKCGHNDYASDLLEEEMGRKELRKLMKDNHLCYPYEVLHSRGWVRVSYNAYLSKIEIFGGCINLTKPMRNTMDPAMNSKQLKVAKKLCEQCDTTLHVAINDKRFW